MMQETKNRIFILLTAALIKIILGAIFYGSIDFIVTLGQGADVIAGNQFNVPYFPIISAYIWLSTLLAAYTPLPLGICFKIFPIFFSSLTAVLVYDIVRTRAPRHAFLAALLFALSPVTLIIDSFHFQWDSIVLFFLIYSFYVRDFYKESPKTYFCAGMFFAVACLVKPYVLMFGLFAAAPLLAFPGGFRFWVKDHISWGIGFCATSALGLLLLHSMGYDIAARWKFIQEYGNGGIVIFGLPRTGILSNYPWLLHRFSVMALMAALLIPYHLRKISTFEAIGVSFALCLTLLGLAPQYLVWSIPFLLIAGSFRGAAIFSFVSGIFLALYYAHPEVSFMHHENMATFAPLRGFGWLTPTVLFWDPGLVGFIRFIGNWLVPLASSASLLLLLLVVLRTPRESQNSQVKIISFSPLRGYSVLSLFPFCLSALCWLIFNKVSVAAAYGAAVSTKQKWYLMQTYAENSYFSLSIPGEGSQLNIVNILVFLSAAWALTAWTKNRWCAKVDSPLVKC